MKGKENNLAAGKQWKTGNLNPSQRISCHPLPPTWLIHPPVFRLIGSRIHSPLPLPDSISRLIKDRWPERNTPTEILSLPFYRKTRNEEFVFYEFRKTSKSIMIFFFLQWFGKKGETPSMRKLQFAERRSNSRLGHLIVNRENWAPLLGEIGGGGGSFTIHGGMVSIDRLGSRLMMSWGSLHVFEDRRDWIMRRV